MTRWCAQMSAGHRRLKALRKARVCFGHGTIQDSTEACSPDRAHMNARNTRLQMNTRRKMSPSLPCTPTAAATMARFCGEIILPSTPPELLLAAISTGDSPALAAAVTCSAPNREFEDVSEPVTATPSQPRMGEI